MTRGSSYITHGMNLREALAAAKALGCDVRSRRRTGEWMVSHHSIDKRIFFNARKKSAPRALTLFLLAIQGFEVAPRPKTHPRTPPMNAKQAQNRLKGRKPPRKA